MGCLCLGAAEAGPSVLWLGVTGVCGVLGHGGVTPLEVGVVELPGVTLRHHLQDVGVLEGALIHLLHCLDPLPWDGAEHLGTPKHPKICAPTSISPTCSTGMDQSTWGPPNTLKDVPTFFLPPLGTWHRVGVQGSPHLPLWDLGIGQGLV